MLYVCCHCYVCVLRKDITNLVSFSDTRFTCQTGELSKAILAVNRKFVRVLLHLIGCSNLPFIETTNQTRKSYSSLTIGAMEMEILNGNGRNFFVVWQH